MVNYWGKRTYGELATTPAGLSERGYVYLVSETFTIAAAASLNLCMTTPASTYTVQFQFYSISTSDFPVSSQLIEAPASITKTASTIVGRNLNRNFSDTHLAVFSNVTAFSGGTTVARELSGTSAKGGGDSASARVHTLKPATDYVMQFTNLGNNTTNLLFSLGWSETEPKNPALWTTVP